MQTKGLPPHGDRKKLFKSKLSSSSSEKQPHSVYRTSVFLSSDLRFYDISGIFYPKRRKLIWEGCSGYERTFVRADFSVGHLRIYSLPNHCKILHGGEE